MLNTKKGFTLIELVIVIAIIGMLAVISMMSWRRQMDKARDAQRKEHLQKISLAFEEYFSDSGCYPAATIIDNCGGSELSPYLPAVPCDPKTDLPYQYIIDDSHPACYRKYIILAKLENDSDPAIAAMGCNTALGCGWDGGYNYGVSSKNIPVTSSTLPSPTPSVAPSPAPPSASPQPSASPLPDRYYCQNIGNCTEISPGKTCEPAYPTGNCDNPINPCAETVSVCH